MEKRAKAQKKYWQSPKGKEAAKRYQTSPEGKETRKKYRQSPEGKESAKKYLTSPKGKETRKKYGQSPEGKEATKKYQASPEGKETRKKYQLKPSTKQKKEGIRFRTALPELEQKTKQFETLKEAGKNDPGLNKRLRKAKKTAGGRVKKMMPAGAKHIMQGSEKIPPITKKRIKAALKPLDIPTEVKQQKKLNLKVEMGKVEGARSTRFTATRGIKPPKGMGGAVKIPFARANAALAVASVGAGYLGAYLGKKVGRQQMKKKLDNYRENLTQGYKKRWGKLPEIDPELKKHWEPFKNR